MSCGVRIRLLAWAALAVFTIPAPRSARAQSLWIPRDRDRCAQIEFLEPGLELIDETFSTAALFLDARYSWASDLAFVVEVLFTRFDGNYEFYIGDPYEEESAFGNPYLGREVGGNGSLVFGEIGARLPLMDDEKLHAAIPGTRSDVTRWDAFIANFVPVHAAINLREVSASGISTRLRLSPVLLIPTKPGYDTDLFGVYAWQIGYEGQTIRVGGALSGRIFFTTNVGNPGTRSTNQFEFHADFGPWSIRPGAELKLPLGRSQELWSGRGILRERPVRARRRIRQEHGRHSYGRST